MEQNTDYKGNDLNPRSPLPTGSPDGCCAACQNTTGCSVWTYDTVQDFCYLKTSSAGRRTYTDRISGFIAASCTTDEDCSLAGVCSESGICECDAAFTGPTCAELNLLPMDADRLGAYNQDPRTSS